MTQEMKQLQAAIDGDVAAFEQIVVRYQSLVCAITFSGCGRQDVSEELAQETFLSAWKNLRQLTNPSGFRAWLCTIARNMVHGYYRSKKTVPLDPADLAGLSDQTPSPSEQLINEEENVMLEKALLKIPVEYREPLVMYYRQEKSVREVAIGLDMNESTVRTRLHRARQMLREEIAARLERTLERSAPDKSFTKAVMLAVGGTAVGMAASASAAAATANAAGTSASAGIAAVMSTVTAKIITAAAVVAVAVGAVVAYTHLTKTEPASTRPDDVAIIQDGQEPAVTPDIPSTTSPEPGAEVAINPIITSIIEPTAVITDVNIAPVPDIDTEPAVTSAIEEIFESLEYNFTPRGMLSGFVIDAETGEPVVDAKIRIRRNIFRERFQEDTYYETETDSNGVYSFDSINLQGNYFISIYSDNYSNIPWEEQHLPIPLRLTRQEIKHFKLNRIHSMKLNVRCVDESGEPVEGVDLFQSEERGGYQDPCYSDINGFASLSLRSTDPLKNYTITALHGDYAMTWVSSKEIDASDVNKIVMRKGVDVKGYAEYSDGKPAGGLWLSALPSNRRGSRRQYAIDSSGHFTLEHIPQRKREHSIVIHSPHEAFGVEPIRINTFILPLQDDELLVIKVPEQSPESLESISGTFTIDVDDENCMPDYVVIRASTGGGSEGQKYYSKAVSVSSNERTFRIDSLIPSSYTLSFSGPNLEPKTIENVAAPGSELEVALQCAIHRRFSGVVVGSGTKKPVRQFMARLKKLEGKKPYPTFKKTFGMNLITRKAAFTSMLLILVYIKLKSLRKDMPGPGAKR